LSHRVTQPPIPYGGSGESPTSIEVICNALAKSLRAEERA
jgi:hypothetical protein